MFIVWRIWVDVLTSNFIKQDICKSSLAIILKLNKSQYVEWNKEIVHKTLN